MKLSFYPNEFKNTLSINIRVHLQKSLSTLILNFNLNNKKTSKYPNNKIDPFEDMSTCSHDIVHIYLRSRWSVFFLLWLGWRGRWPFELERPGEGHKINCRNQSWHHQWSNIFPSGITGDGQLYGRGSRKPPKPCWKLLMPRVYRQLITRELEEGEFSSGSSATPTNVDLHTMILLESFIFFLLPLSLSCFPWHNMVFFFFMKNIWRCSCTKIPFQVTGNWKSQF